jgi:carbon monoxide dehydrogenase subunit G
VHGVDDGVGHLLRGAGLVRVLDAQDELAAVLPGVEVVEERRAGAADMQVPVGLGGKRVTICVMVAFSKKKKRSRLIPRITAGWGCGCGMYVA